jgi:hypothetical protein
VRALKEYPQLAESVNEVARERYKVATPS